MSYSAIDSAAKQKELQKIIDAKPEAIQIRIQLQKLDSYNDTNPVEHGKPITDEQRDYRYTYYMTQADRLIDSLQKNS